ncbi:retrotransposon nucleocapsid related protein [Cyclospora cayetanensis]|uniref:Retrotransposon nucleocapsid related protein n=1 Tax=Cyclospora cayetanensis TaxID=88456 RepID=A0A1D3CYU1_9EIME|nr:retrotransposon nucleocapsid related protein [Cyclospora cayetanensis]
MTWTSLHMNCTVGLPKVKAQGSIYDILDRLSKYAHFVTCSSFVRAYELGVFAAYVWKLYVFSGETVMGMDISLFVLRISIYHNAITSVKAIMGHSRILGPPVARVYRICDSILIG